MLGHSERYWELLRCAGRCWDWPGDAGTRRAVAGDGPASGRQPAVVSSHPPQCSPLTRLPVMPQQSQRNGVQPGRAQHSPGTDEKTSAPFYGATLKGFLSLCCRKAVPARLLCSSGDTPAFPTLRRAGGVSPPLPRMVQKVYWGDTVWGVRKAPGHTLWHANGSAAATIAASSSQTPIDGLIFLGAGVGREEKH